MQSSHHCKNCGNTFTGNYCNQCGERVFTHHDRSILHFFEDAVHFITHFEGTFFNTLRAIATKPGKWSQDFCQGIRKKYFRPLSFFMLLVVLYLIFPLFVGLNMPFRYYVGDYQYARDLTMRKTNISLDDMARRTDSAAASMHFDTRQERNRFWYTYMENQFKQNPTLVKLETSYNKTAEKVSKILLLLLIPLTALVLYVFSFLKRRYLYDHLVLATELNSVYLIVSFFLVPALYFVFKKLAGPSLVSHINDQWLSAFSYFLVGSYATFAFRRFYGLHIALSAGMSFVVMYAHTYIVYVIYKFILFALSLYLS